MSCVRGRTKSRKARATCAKLHPSSRTPRASAPARRSGSRATSALYQKTRALRVLSPVSTPLAFRLPTGAAGEKTPETPQQAARGRLKAERRAQEATLWQAYLATHSEESRNALWLHYLPLVRYIAERIKAKLPESVELGDLAGSGHVGLQDAIVKFDPDMGVRFETYCVPRIRGAILDSIRAMDWIPRLIRNKTHQYERIVRELAAKLKREPTDEEIARKLGISYQELYELKKELAVKSQISVEGNKDRADGREVTRIEMLEHPERPEPTRDLQREEVRHMALRGLNRNERTVVEQYYFRGRSMKHIGEQLGLSESRICQIHSGVLDILRRKFRAYQDSCYIG